jgi:hypothetical protein
LLVSSFCPQNSRYKIFIFNFVAVEMKKYNIMASYKLGKQDKSCYEKTFNLVGPLCSNCAQITEELSSIFGYTINTLLMSYMPE